jgi:lactoylglutathione lyase
MLVNHLFTPIILLILQTTWACIHSTTTSTTIGPAPAFPTIVAGSNEPADWATMGYVLNHFSLNVNNLTASIDFYTKVFGLRLIFTFYASERFSITYMAHSHGGKNGTAYQTVDDLNKYKNNMEGLLELIYYDSPDSNRHLIPSTQVTNTFSHLGMIVRDIQSVQERMETLGVRIVKPYGQFPSLDGEIAVAFGLGGVYQRDPVEAGQLFEALKLPGMLNFVFVTDPDGNFIEIQDQETPQLPFTG